jgi:hypothetical protein
LTSEHVQDDPIVATSRLSIKIELQSAGFTETHYENPIITRAIENHLLQEVNRRTQKCQGQIKGPGRTGDIATQAQGQKIIRRSGLRIKNDILILTLFPGLPRDGRELIATQPKAVNLRRRWSLRLTYQHIPVHEQLINHSIY